MKAPTPLEVCKQIASEHAANTTAAIAEKRAARFAAGMQEYGRRLAELATTDGEPGTKEEGEWPRS